MNNRFKDFSFIKKVISIFIIGICVFILGIGGIFIIANMSSSSYLGGHFNSKNASHMDSIIEDDNDSGLSYNNSYSSDNTEMDRDFSFTIDTKDIIETVDAVIQFANERDGIVEYSQSGDRGYGYVDFKVPSNKVDSTMKELRKEFNVISYECDASNVSGNYKDIDSRIEYLESKLENLKESLDKLEKQGADTSSIITEISDIEDELYQLKESKKNIDSDVDYSSMYVEIIDKNYTEFSTFDGIGYAIKAGAHIFVLGLIYGAYFIVYGFIMFGIVKLLLMFFKRIFKNKNELE